MLKKKRAATKSMPHTRVEPGERESMSLTANPVATAYRGAAAQSAFALGLGKDVAHLGDEALKVLTSAMPLIEGMDRIAGIGIQYTPSQQAPSSAGVPATPRSSGNSIA